MNSVLAAFDESPVSYKYPFLVKSLKFFKLLYDQLHLYPHQFTSQNKYSAFYVFDKQLYILHKFNKIRI